MDNVILSPHSGSYGVGAKKTQITMVCQLLPDALTVGKLPRRYVANRAVLDKDLGLKFI